MKTIEEKREYTRQWRKNNPEKVKLQNKKKYEKDKQDPERTQRRKEMIAEWYQKNKDKQRDYQREWSKDKLGDIKEKIFDYPFFHIIKKCCRIPTTLIKYYVIIVIG